MVSGYIFLKRSNDIVHFTLGRSDDETPTMLSSPENFFTTRLVVPSIPVRLDPSRIMSIERDEESVGNKRNRVSDFSLLSGRVEILSGHFFHHMESLSTDSFYVFDSQKICPKMIDSTREGVNRRSNPKSN